MARQLSPIMNKPLTITIDTLYISLPNSGGRLHEISTITAAPVAVLWALM